MEETRNQRSFKTWMVTQHIPLHVYDKLIADGWDSFNIIQHMTKNDADHLGIVLGDWLPLRDAIKKYINHHQLDTIEGFSKMLHMNRASTIYLKFLITSCDSIIYNKYS